MDWTLAVSFDTDDPEFVRGVEFGRLWARCAEPAGFEQTIHATNAEMALRLGEATGREVRAEPLDDTWMTLTVGPMP